MEGVGFLMFFWYLSNRRRFFSEASTNELMQHWRGICKVLQSAASEDGNGDSPDLDLSTAAPRHEIFGA